MQKGSIVTLLVIVLIVIGAGVYMFGAANKNPTQDPNSLTNTNTNENNTPAAPEPEGERVVLGKSVEGRDIVAYNYGTGDTRILLVGGVHGGYSWNTALLAYQAMDYLKENPEEITANVKVTVIPVLNPDGLNEAVGTADKFSTTDVTKSQTVLVASRLNANNVDLSRNFDCDWQSKAVWQTKPVSGGSSVFSEPESLAIKNYVESHDISAAVVWYSAAGGVYASSCGDDILSETTTITDLYARAANYPAHQNFDAYATTGDLVGWLAKKNIPAISVLLTTHNDTELSKNTRGIQALLKNYSKE